MSLTLAILIPGLIFLVLGGALLSGNSGVVSLLKGLPRSMTATYLFFGAGAVAFLYQVWHLSPADFGDHRGLLFIAFSAIAVLSFSAVPDFLAVRGLCVLVLVGASPLLHAAYMEYDHPLRLFMVTPVFVALALAIWLGAQPWRLRDFFEWLFRPGGRARAVGGAFLAYGVLLSVIAFTY
ncbi:MAG TPA: hypothetical protein VG838_10950 [Opitutaceae bacterium]|nr:hypothetical protein [Opitutaceae bacterium]